MPGLNGVRSTRLLAAIGLALVLGLLQTTTAVTKGAVAEAATDVAPPGAYNIYTTLACQCFNGQRTIAYRVGYYVPPDTGFGHRKVLYKHNMFTKIVAFIVAGPNHQQTRGSAGKAWAWAVHLVNGQIVEIVEIRAFYDTRILSDHRSFGIVTAYCNGYVRCPQWVDQAINASVPAGQPDAVQLDYVPPTAQTAQSPALASPR